MISHPYRTDEFLLHVIALGQETEAEIILNYMRQNSSSEEAAQWRCLIYQRTRNYLKNHLMDFQIKVFITNHHIKKSEDVLLAVMASVQTLFQMNLWKNEKFEPTAEQVVDTAELMFKYL